MEQLTEGQKKLVTDNYRLIYAFLKKVNVYGDYLKLKGGKGFPGQGSGRRNRADPDYIQAIFDAAEIGLIKAAKKYDPARGAFSTLAFICMDAQFRSLKKRRGEHRHLLRYEYETSLENLTDEDEDGKALPVGENDPAFDYVDERESLEQIIKKFYGLLSDSEKRVLGGLLDGLNSAEIARREQISRQAVEKKIKHIREKARPFFFGREV